MFYKNLAIICVSSLLSFAYSCEVIVDGVSMTFGDNVKMYPNNEDVKRVIIGSDDSTDIVYLPNGNQKNVKFTLGFSKSFFDAKKVIDKKPELIMGQRAEYYWNRYKKSLNGRSGDEEGVNGTKVLYRAGALVLNTQFLLINSRG